MNRNLRPCAALWCSVLLLLMFRAGGDAAPLPDLSVSGGCDASGCHASLVAGRFVHEPAGEGECLECHKSSGEPHPAGGKPGFLPVSSGAELCYRCHDRFGGSKTVHSPVEEGDCLACHDPHSSDIKGLVRQEDGLSGVCFQCHDQQAFRHRVCHGPVDAGECTACHMPHQSDNPALLTTEGRKLCTGCHTDIAQGLEKAAYVHAALEEKSCQACHDVHGSDLRGLLKNQMPGLCSQCHADIGERVRHAKVRHRAVKIKARCANCHNIHYSQNPHLLVREQQELCLGCHGDDKGRGGRTGTRNIIKEVEGRKLLHGPLKKGNCAGCHEVHGSDFSHLLSGPYPDAFYASYRRGIYGFCWTCHEEKMLFRPVTEKFTGFRNGDMNLHFLHVARQQKGRTCTACHAPHASNWPCLVDDMGAPFGYWRIPIDFTKTDTGGSCTPGCHATKVYDRRKPVDYLRERQTGR